MQQCKRHQIILHYRLYAKRFINPLVITKSVFDLIINTDNLTAQQVIDVTKLSGSVKFGATVHMIDEDTEAERTLQIVGEHEANVEKNQINMNSPIARALIGKEKGDSVEVRTPGGVKSYEIISISFI